MAELASDSESSASDPLDLRNDEGWEDVEPDEEKESIVCLFSQEVFPDVNSMLRHCKEAFQFDFIKIRSDLALNFLETIKLVNYVRSEVNAGNSKPDVSSKAAFEDEKYLKPYLEDDALLYGLDDIVEYPSRRTETDRSEHAKESSDADLVARIVQLQEELERTQAQFAEYRQFVQRSLDAQFDREVEQLPSTGNTSSSKENPGGLKSRDNEDESLYFSSYSYNTIHESMLKDTIRTDAYRDFIYDNKHLFKDKVVLDVGCGTGILSIFCAKAGAKMVIAVDNSDIVDKAREIVFDNGLGDVVKCLRGKIEEVHLPVDKVDVIVSEWMGYCLLFEAMLDSVIWARDHYLSPDGLMVPSHATLRIAPLTDPDLIDSYVSFWNSVYGFKMTSMLANIYDEALVQSVEASALAGYSTTFLQLPLHTISTTELTFVKPFSMTLTQEVDVLDGFAIWFDIFFMPSRTSNIPEGAFPKDMMKKGFVSFTTGPEGLQTHWQQVVLLIDHGKKDPISLKKGQVIEGHVGFQKKAEKSRLLDIEVRWKAEGAGQGQQVWSLQ